MKNKDHNVKDIELSDVKSNPDESVSITGKNYALIKGVSVEAKIAIGSVTVKVADLFELKAGEVLGLDSDIDDPVYLIVNDETIASGRLVSTGGCYGIQITELK